VCAYNGKLTTHNNNTTAAAETHHESLLKKHICQSYLQFRFASTDNFMPGIFRIQHKMFICLPDVTNKNKNYEYGKILQAKAILNSEINSFAFPPAPPLIENGARM